MKSLRLMFSPLPWLFFLTLLLLLSGCKGGFNTPTDPLRKAIAKKIPNENVFVAEDYDSQQPLSVAVLPFDNQTKEPEAAKLLRRLFYNNFSSLAYEDIELSQVDAALNTFDPAIAFEAEDASKIAPQIKADAIIVGRITKFETLYAGLYASFSVGFQLKMLDPNNNQILWSVKHEETQRSGKVPLSPVGAIIAAATTVMDISRYNMINASNKLCQTSIDTIPPSANLKGRSFPRIFTLAHDGVNRTLKKGDKLQVGVEGSNGLKASFIISPGKDAVTMHEKESGSYIGTYIVRDGDDLKDGQIVVTLTDQWKNQCRWEDILGLVNFDGIAPDSPTGIKTKATDSKVALSWNQAKAQDLAGYQILRSKTPLSGYKQVSFTEFTRYEDTGLTNDTTYFYRILAKDKAGNESQVMAGIGATPVPEGPTLVSGELGPETVWHPGGNPYFIDEEVLLPSGNRLTIEPGVLIKAADTTRFLVKGQLVVNGDANAPVVFTADHDGGTWEGLVFDHSDKDCSMKHFEISQAIAGISIVEASPLIESGIIKNCQTGLLIAGEKASPLVRNLTVYRNQKAGIISRDLAQPSIITSKIAYNGAAGLNSVRSSGKVLGSEISYNRIGVKMNQASTTLAGNRIQYNLKGDLESSGTNLSGLKLDLNFFGPPEDVTAYSSDLHREQTSLTVLKSHDWRGPKEQVALLKFPDKEAPDSDQLLKIFGNGSDNVKLKKEASVSSSKQEEKTDDQTTASKDQSVPDEKSPENSFEKSPLDAFIQGVSLARKGDYSEAIVLLDQALEDTSREAEVRFWLGFCYIQSGQVKKALAEYNKAVRLDPDNIEYLLHLGSALHLSDNLKKAEVVYREVLRRHPENEDAQLFLKLLKKK